MNLLSLALLIIITIPITLANQTEVNPNSNSISSFANLISQRDLIKRFLDAATAVQTISFAILLQANPSAWDSLITQVMDQFQSNYSFNVLREPYEPFSAGQDDNRLAALEHAGFIIGGHVDRPFEINNAALWRRNGHYLILLADAQTEEQVVSWLREMWTRVGSVTVMTIFRGRLWAYRPFKRAVNGSSFGQIEMFTSDDPANYKRQVLRDLHGYPLRLEFFEAGYNVAVRNQAKRVQYYVGPDKETIAILQKRMNFTGKAHLRG